MLTVGLYVQLEAKPGKEKELEAFLKGALDLVKKEPETRVWFALRLSESKFGIFDAFAKEEGRKAHLDGEVAKALFANAETLLAKAPEIVELSVLAARF